VVNNAFTKEAFKWLVWFRGNVLAVATSTKRTGFTVKIATGGMWLLMDKKKIRQIVHLIGLASTFTAVLTMTVCFWAIAYWGYFNAIEPNPYVLIFEMCVSGMAVAYWLYLCGEKLGFIKPEVIV